MYCPEKNMSQCYQQFQKLIFVDFPDGRVHKVRLSNPSIELGAKKTLKILI